MRVAVTGAAGFVGSAVVRACLRAGHEVHAIDDLSTGLLERINDARRRHPDGQDAVWFEKADAAAVHYGEDDALIHCAAYADISRNWATAQERADVWRLGAELTREVLERFGSSRRRPFALLSTCAVYGGGRVVSTQGALSIESPYAASKLASEALVCAFHHGNRIVGSIARLVSCVGQHYWHGHIADFVAMAKRDGVIRARDDGSQRHSYVHVDDAAERIVSMLSGAHKKPGVRNISSPAFWSWRDTVEVMRETNPVEVVPGEQRAAWIGDTLDLHVDETLGCERLVSQGVREALVSLGWRGEGEAP